MGRRRTNAMALVGAVVLGFCLVTMALAGFGAPVDFLIQLLLGWLLFLVRVVPQLHLNWAGLATALVCLVGLVYGSQRFLQWLYAHATRAEDAEAPTPRRWRLRWTLMLLGVVVLMFVAGIAGAGLTHQVAWLVTSPEPMVQGGLGNIAKRITSANNLKEMGRGVYGYDEAYGHFPPGGTFDAEGRGLHGWQTMLLPYSSRRTCTAALTARSPGPTRRTDRRSRRGSRRTSTRAWSPGPMPTAWPSAITRPTPASSAATASGRGPASPTAWRSPSWPARPPVITNPGATLPTGATRPWASTPRPTASAAPLEIGSSSYFATVVSTGSNPTSTPKCSRP